MAGAPKGQKRITKALAAEFNVADEAARAELLTQYATYGKADEDELKTVLEAKHTASSAAPVTGATSSAPDAWVSRAKTIGRYDALTLDQITAIRDTAQVAIDAFSEREKIQKRREIEELEQRLEQLKAEIS